MFLLTVITSFPRTTAAAVWHRHPQHRNTPNLHLSAGNPTWLPFSARARSHSQGSFAGRALSDARKNLWARPGHIGGTAATLLN
jgi:hypothetical protein